MPRISLLLIVLFIAGCGKDKYDAIELKAGMTIQQVKDELGEPDSYDKGEQRVNHSRNPVTSWQVDEMLRYGPFSHGSKTDYRLSCYFTAGKLTRWDRGTPSKE